MRFIGLVFFSLAFLVALSWAVAQPKPARVAILIGNKNYTAKVGPLINPHNDVRRVGEALREVNFEIIDELRDGRRASMLEAVHAMGERLRSSGSGSVGFLYYTGHGVALGDENLLLPTDMTDTKESSLRIHGVRLSEILDVLNRLAPDATKFVVLDACRNSLRAAPARKVSRSTKDSNRCGTTGWAQ